LQLALERFSPAERALPLRKMVRVAKGPLPWPSRTARSPTKDQRELARHAKSAQNRKTVRNLEQAYGRNILRGIEFNLDILDRSATLARGQLSIIANQ
jgi:hypothetical protein